MLQRARESNVAGHDFDRGAHGLKVQDFACTSFLCAAGVEVSPCLPRRQRCPSQEQKMPCTACDKPSGDRQADAAKPACDEVCSIRPDGEWTDLMRVRHPP